MLMCVHANSVVSRQRSHNGELEKVNAAVSLVVRADIQTIEAAASIAAASAKSPCIQYGTVRYSGHACQPPLKAVS